jgi:hypothetical protein
LLALLFSPLSLRNTLQSTVPQHPGGRKSFKSGTFSVVENVVLRNRVVHTFHHEFTTKKPRRAHRFLQNPLQNDIPPQEKNYGRYFAGIGLVGDSASQKMFTTQ